MCRPGNFPQQGDASSGSTEPLVDATQVSQGGCYLGRRAAIVVEEFGNHLALHRTRFPCLWGFGGSFLAEGFPLGLRAPSAEFDTAFRE
jgi:hypothetical protein